MAQRQSASVMTKITDLNYDLVTHQVTVEHFDYLVKNRSYVLTPADIREIDHARKRIAEIVRHLEQLNVCVQNQYNDR